MNDYPPVMPIYYVPLLSPIRGPIDPTSEILIDTRTLSLKWILHRDFFESKDLFYQCENAVYATGAYQGHSTPKFRGQTIPEEVVDFMHDYAKVFQAGMAYEALTRPENGQK